VKHPPPFRAGLAGSMPVKVDHDVEDALSYDEIRIGASIGLTRLEIESSKGITSEAIMVF
jgi:hypothetical protein